MKYFVFGNTCVKRKPVLNGISPECKHTVLRILMMEVTAADYVDVT